jgi:uncharacterized DUF497 family protein
MQLSANENKRKSCRQKVDLNFSSRILNSLEEQGDEEKQTQREIVRRRSRTLHNDYVRNLYSLSLLFYYNYQSDVRPISTRRTAQTE